MALPKDEIKKEQKVDLERRINESAMKGIKAGIGIGILSGMFYLYTSGIPIEHCSGEKPVFPSYMCGLDNLGVGTRLYYSTAVAGIVSLVYGALFGTVGVISARIANYAYIKRLKKINAE